jgi:Fic family protein
MIGRRLRDLFNEEKLKVKKYISITDRSKSKATRYFQESEEINVFLIKG